MQKILVAGTGQIGSRYLQGLAQMNERLEVWAYDISTQALATAKNRWHEIKQNYGHQINFCSSLDNLPKSFEIAIVASTAKDRPQLIRSLSKQTDIQSWILEKLLAQSVSGLKSIASSIPKNSKCWVNTPMLRYPLYARLQKKFSEKPIYAQFHGVTGIACNAIHYIDYIARCKKTKISSIDTTELKTWMPYVKRPNHFDVEGMINICFNEGSTLSIRGSAGSRSTEYRFSIEESSDGARKTWSIHENEGKAISSLGECIVGKAILLQSETTHELIECINKNQNPCLPTFQESMEQHQPLLEALVNHWNKVMQNKISELPST